MLEGPHRGMEKKYPVCIPEYLKEKDVNPYAFVKSLSDATPENETVFVDTGCAVAWMTQAFEFKKGQRLFHDYNNTAMGYALPASIGACIALDGKSLTCVTGDGSLQMNIQELATVVRHRLPIRIFLLNNKGYSMIQQTQDQWLDSRYEGSTIEGGLAFPDFVRVADAYGYKTFNISRNDELESTIRRVFSTPGPVFCNVNLRPEHRVIPQVKFGRALEDSEPLLDHEEFLKNMIVAPDRALLSSPVAYSIASLKPHIELDRAIAFGVLSRVWPVISGPITIVLIASYFSPSMQGYYYTFNSLLALQVLAELGFGQVIMQFMSHEWSKLSITADRRIVGEASRRPVKSLQPFQVGGCVVHNGGIILAIGLATFGLYFSCNRRMLRCRGNSHGSLFLCVLIGVRLAFLPFWSLLEGSNQVTELYAYRCLETLATSLAAWTVIISGAGLWAVTVSVLAAVLSSLAFVVLRYRAFFVGLLRRRNGPKIHWKKELWPMQWRIAISWLSGYFLFQFFIPVIFHYKGSAEAGRVGLTWNIAAALAAVCGTWVAVRRTTTRYAHCEKGLCRTRSSVLALELQHRRSCSGWHGGTLDWDLCP